MYYFIVNIVSRTGKTKKFWENIKAELKKQKITYEAYVTKYQGHASELADMVCTKAIEYKKNKKQEEKVCLVVVGGDGTVNEVVNGMHHFEEIYFGYIAAGSGNDLGRGLGIPKNSMAALERVLNAREVYPMDLGKVKYGKEESRYFAISSGIGIDADVCRMAITSGLKKFLNQIHLGNLTYLLLTIKALFTMPTVDVAIRLPKEEERKIGKMIFVAAMNHPWEGGGVPMAPNADPQDGHFSICLTHGMNRLQAFGKLLFLIRGKHQNLKGVEMISCNQYQLLLKKPMALHGDGEYLGDFTKISYTCEKGKLKVLK